MRYQVKLVKTVKKSLIVHVGDIFSSKPSDGFEAMRMAEAQVRGDSNLHEDILTEESSTVTAVYVEENPPDDY